MFTDRPICWHLILRATDNYWEQIGCTNYYKKNPEALANSRTGISVDVLLAGHFLDLINSSYSNLHEMFTWTYGGLYKQNADIFVDLFSSLRFSYNAEMPPEHRHHRQRGVADTAVVDDTDDVRRCLDRFFVVLMRRMLTLMSGDHAPPSDRFLYCVSSSIDQLRPFGDVPSKLSMQLHRAFVTARAFVVGLTAGADFIATLSKVGPTHSIWRTIVLKHWLCGMMQSHLI